MVAFLQNADVSTFLAQTGNCFMVSAMWMYPHFWLRLVFVRVSGMWIHYIRMNQHCWPRLANSLGVSRMWIHLYIEMYPHSAG